MRYRISVAALVLTCAAVAIGVPLAGADKQIAVGTKDNGLSICEEQYLALYDQAQAKFGSGTVGANVVDDGVGKYDAYDLPESLTCEKADLLDRWLHPPAPAPEPASETATEYTEPAAAPTYSGGTSSSTVMCESGGNYAADTGNGYYGGYQFDSGTWDAYGDPAYGEASEAPPAVQDAAAASVPYDAWPNC